MDKSISRSSDVKPEEDIENQEEQETLLSLEELEEIGIRSRNYLNTQMEQAIKNGMWKSHRSVMAQVIDREFFKSVIVPRLHIPMLVNRTIRRI